VVSLVIKIASDPALFSQEKLFIKKLNIILVQASHPPSLSFSSKKQKNNTKPCLCPDSEARLATQMALLHLRACGC